MYSPKVSESLIPVLYRLRRVRRVPMTKLVHQLLVKALESETLPDEIKAMLGTTGGTAKREQAA